MSNIDLLPRADLPVIWNEFRMKAALCRDTAESLVVTDVSQKEAMALARKTRLTLREIRIAVEHKRVELGEGHLKEIQKVNGAAKAIREFIEPLEARLLVQETFAERAEEKRVTELAVSRGLEVMTLRPGISLRKGLGNLSQAEYDEYLDVLRTEKAELEAANRLRIEAERKLAEAQAEAERQRKETAAILNAKLEAQRKEAEEKAQEVYAELKRQNEAEQAIRVIERLRLDAEKRIQDDKLAVLEAELKVERAAKLAEETRLRQLALAPDLEKLREFKDRLRFVIGPELEDESAKAICWEAVCLVHKAATLLNKFYEENLTTERPVVY